MNWTHKRLWSHSKTIEPKNTCPGDSGMAQYPYLLAACRINSSFFAIEIWLLNVSVIVDRCTIFIEQYFLLFGKIWNRKQTITNYNGNEPCYPTVQALWFCCLAGLLGGVFVNFLMVWYGMWCRRLSHGWQICTNWCNYQSGSHAPTFCAKTGYQKAFWWQKLNF